jgi:hypothetical protein
MSTRHRALFGGFFILLALGFAAPIAAQTVTPQPATTVNPLTVEYTLLEDGCFSSIEDQAVSIEGTSIEIDVTVGPWRSGARCTPPVPLILKQTFGPLPPGEYQVSVVGTIFGTPFGPETTPFSVEAGPFGNLVAPIPALSFWALGVLGLMVGIVGVVVIRR